MGTRHLICIVAGGSYKLAQYGQWDGYPSGQGENILNFLSQTENVDRLSAGLQNLYEPSETETKGFYERLGIKVNDGWIAYEDSKKFSEAHPSLSRDTGSKILSIIANSKDKIPTQKAIEFANDSLFCEWAYVIDLDAGVLEVFQGFNETPLEPGERFYSDEAPQKCATGNTYHPVKLKKIYPLSALPTKDQFLADLEPSEDEEGDENA